MTPATRSSVGTVAALVVLLGAACTEKTDRPSAKTPPGNAVPVPVSRPEGAPKTAPVETGAAIPVDPSALEARPTELAFLPDGTLAVTTEREIVTVGGADATIRRAPLPKGARVVLSPLGKATDGVVLERADETTLLRTPSLEPIFVGRGRAMLEPAGAVELDGPAPAVVMQLGGKLVRLDASPGPASTGGAAADRRAAAVVLTADRTRAVVTWTTDAVDAREATVHDAATGARLGRAYPITAYEVLPRATLRGNVEVAVDGERLVFLDLTTAKILRSAKIACGKDKSLGNPLPSPRGDYVVVTCGDEGLILDGRTLIPKRRVPRIVPGCDNGEMLPALYRESAPTELVIEGCGGEARVDLVTGKYRCGDNEGVTGAPYDMGQGGPTRAPHDRRALPRCTKEVEEPPVPLGYSGRYRLGMGEAVEIEGGAKGTIRLEDGASTPVFSRDEARVAYLLRDRVVVRGMPEGTVLLELVHRSP